MPSPGPAGRARTLVLDHLGHGVNDQAAPDYFWSGYIELTDLVIRARLGGREGLLRLLYRRRRLYPAAGLARALSRGGAPTVSEIDPEVTRAARDRLWLDPAGMRILHGRCAGRADPGAGHPESAARRATT